jgi:hypothetical protein
MPPLLHHIEDDTRIEVGATRAHREAVERCKSHGRPHAPAPLRRAHAGLAAEMGDHAATLGGFWTEHIGKNAGNILNP